MRSGLALSGGLTYHTPDGQVSLKAGPCVPFGDVLVSRLNRRLPDTLCPECHGEYTLVRVNVRALVKRCQDCGHEWREERSAEKKNGIIRKGGYVDRDAEIRIDDQGDLQ